MLFVADETGTFDLARPGFDPSFWVTIAVPPLTADLLRSQVRAWCNEWDIEELHAVHLAPEQRAQIAAYLSGTDFVWVATGTAQDLMTPAIAEQWRSDQAENLREAYQRSEERGTVDPRYAGRGEELLRLATNRRRVPLAAFVQYGIVAGRHFADIVQAAVRRYSDRPAALSWTGRAVLVDGKGKGRHGGPVLMRELLYPILATLPISLPASLAREQPLDRLRHGMKVSELLGGDPRFIDNSASEPLIQVSDLIAWTIRRRLTHPEEASTEESYRKLLRRAAEVDGFRVRMMWRNGHEPADVSRYGVLWPEPT